MRTPPPSELYRNRWTRTGERATSFLARHWLLWLNLTLGLYALLPWLSPLLRSWGWEQAGRLLFRLYTPLCHQQPALSYTFRGYQVAYCHRDTAIYSTLLLGSLLFGLWRRRIRPLPGWAFLLSLLPMGLDGLTHTLAYLVPAWSFRRENTWAILLTGGRLPPSFYAGDAIGSLNWWLRTLSGVLFALGVVLFIYPRIEAELPGQDQPDGPTSRVTLST